MMRLPPDDVIAGWPPPNYDHPQTRGPCLLLVQMILMPLALLALLARLYVRGCLMKKIGVDDWLMLAAMVFVIGTTITVILASEVYGWKIHIWDLTEGGLVLGRKASIAAQMLYLFASGLAKMSILTAYLRIAPLDSWFRRLTIGAMPLVGALIGIFLIVLWTQCIPASAYWNLEIEEKKCVEEGPPLIGQAVTSVLTDLLIYILPLPTLRALNLPRRQRIALLLVFSLGFVVVLAGCMRLYWVAEVVNNTYDVTWDGFVMWIWTAVEVNLGVICGCAPTLRPLFRFFSAEIRRVSNNGGSGGVSGGGGQGMVRCRRVEGDSAPWFGDLNWLEGSNWLGSLGLSDTKDESPGTSVRGLGVGGGEGERKGSQGSDGHSVVPVSTADSVAQGQQASIAEIA